MLTSIVRPIALPLAALAVAAAVAACSPRASHEAGPRAGMVLIPAGEFLMGTGPDDSRTSIYQKAAAQPRHPVRVGAFHLDVHETTNAEFERLIPGHPRDPKSSCDGCPVTNVTWFEARDYCAAQRPPKRLPTEAEWEKAARGGAPGEPEALETQAWFFRNSGSVAHPVGQLAPNGYGLHDMLGNAREWTADWYDAGYYAAGVGDDPKGPPTGQYRVERGGAFFMPARNVTAAIRYNHPPTIRLFFLGFRCAQDP